MQGTAFATEEFDDGESNRVWTPWRSGCDYAVRTIVNGRSANQLESFGAIEYPHNKQMGKAFDVGEACFELRKNFKNAFRVVLSAETLGDLLRACVGTLDLSDGLRRKHFLIHPCRKSPLGRRQVFLVLFLLRFLG